ncbi:metallophosphoesterase [Caldalkalibacillus thermarum TA2.A1]|uniref:Bis(5'-nucleosyl)-tetraphosphatase PrpE n=1 Tax=Caldalkalibacillus thermarum (strain TA2.A1) TaxID=986075 RepID=F5L505_CALTT|nr:bis(5'-nucleosyl)-tetraphosphatase PrpE [Caldalkalibacillus thermarum]EGL83581.1 metallophosphoesterase [Caldalkalibacillus thermarum TA2.A1]QZT35119.1 bis(5'-nucleosyl)-tetraphosphatase PrpE [Caldalkalibacillus thermarum TA2.A1]
MYDIIGDVHGCYRELLTLLGRLGYREQNGLYFHHQGRKIVFVGDITDRGPQSINTLRFVIRHVEAGQALYVPGNHCDKLYRFFLGRNVQITHGLETTVEEYHRLPVDEKKWVKTRFIRLVENAPLYLVLDGGRLIVSHAGIRQDMIGKHNKAVKTFCLYGDITGEKDNDGFPVRRDWAKHYTGEAWIVYGHTPVKKPRFVNHTVNIDTGCVFGGHLTGLRYPELTFEMVPSSLPFVPEKFRLD